MALRTGDPRRETFDTIIGELKADGTLNELLSKWFGETAPLFDVSQ
jgi:polar amino acid transport system substrate-binding protein